MKKFEYKRAFDPSVDNLNDWGKEGWELIAVTSDYNSTYVFKRVIDEPQKISSPTNQNSLTSTDAFMEAAIKECDPGDRIAQIKFIKEVMHLGLREAKDIVRDYHIKHAVL